MIITTLRKHLEGTVAENTLKHGCGALNIDSCRISTSDNLNGGAYAENPIERHDGKENWRYERGNAGDYVQPNGRWPANFILIHKEGCESQGEDWACVEGCPVKELDQQSGICKSTTRSPTGNPIYSTSNTSVTWNANNVMDTTQRGFDDVGGASRFFKQFKKDNNQ